MSNTTLESVLQEIENLRTTLRQKKAEHRMLLSATADPAVDSKAIEEKDKALKAERNALLEALAVARNKAEKAINVLIDGAKTVEELCVAAAHLKSLSLPQARAQHKLEALDPATRRHCRRLRHDREVVARRSRRSRRLEAIKKAEEENHARNLKAKAEK